jgi:thiamine biosynthesis lipoprotein
MTTDTVERTWTPHTFAAMGTAVTVTLPGDADAPTLTGRVEELFARVQRSCTRFSDDSDLMRANRSPQVAHEVAPECAAIVDAAFDAYRATDGLFDPRILEHLVSAGYDRTFAEVPSVSDSSGAQPPSLPAGSPWRPRVDTRRSVVELGPTPIDLGGIGKGWTVDAAAAVLKPHVADFLVNAGGDLVVSGDGPNGDGWTAAIEDPLDGARTLAVLQLGTESCATSSTGRRRWIKDGAAAHHLIDPRTGRPATGGLQSVTVIADTTVIAEVWSKALLIAGADVISQFCARRDLAAYWMTTDGETSYSPAMATHVAWDWCANVS